MKCIATRFVSAVVAFGATAALDLTATSVAQAGPAQQVVSYADLNLYSPAGVEVLRNRLEFASKQVCGPEQLPQDFNAREHYSACVKETLERAVDSLPAAYAYNLREGIALEMAEEK